MVYKVLLFTLVVADKIVEPVVKAVVSPVDARAKVTACGQGEAVNAQERADSRCEEEEDEAGRQQRRSPPDRCSVAREQPEVLRHAGRAAAGRGTRMARSSSCSDLAPLHSPCRHGSWLHSGTPLAPYTVTVFYDV